jgi:hypothetical protein
VAVLDWLLDSDPALRWQVLRDLTDAAPDAVAAERARVATGGWGARLLALRDDDGRWAGGAYFPARPPDEPGQPWTATTHVLLLLREFGLDPASPAARETLALVRDGARWEHAGQRYFDGEVEPCINGAAVAIGAYFGVDVDGIVERLLDDQLADGGWNCWAEHGAVVSSFASTINVVEGLLAHERATGGSARVTTARRRGEGYLLERSLFRRRSTGEVVDADWLRFAFPTRWHYDVLRALDHLRAAGDPPDPRAAEAIELVRSKRQPDGTWSLDRTHPGAVHFPLETTGEPSRWTTLRALRVLRWADG